MRKELEKALNSIGWGISESSNMMTDWIFNDKGENTEFIYRHGTIRNLSNDMFGREYKGSINFKLENCEIETEVNAVHVAVKNNSGVFISFYNFNKKED
jgi:hypothetical protein